MADKSEVTATCPFCRRPQTILPSAGRVVCRHCQNAFAWDNKTASAIILPPPSLSREKKAAPSPSREKESAPKNHGERTPPKSKALSPRRIVFIILILLALACLGALAYFYPHPPPKPSFPDNLDPASVLEDVGKQLKAITE